MLGFLLFCMVYCALSAGQHHHRKLFRREYASIWSSARTLNLAAPRLNNSVLAEGAYQGRSGKEMALESGGAVCTADQEDPIWPGSCNRLLTGYSGWNESHGWHVDGPRGWVKVSFSAPCVLMYRFQATQDRYWAMKSWELHVVSPEGKDTEAELKFGASFMYHEFKDYVNISAVILKRTSHEQLRYGHLSGISVTGVPCEVKSGGPKGSSGPWHCALVLSLAACIMVVNARMEAVLVILILCMAVPALSMEQQHQNMLLRREQASIALSGRPLDFAPPRLNTSMLVEGASQTRAGKDMALEANGATCTGDRKGEKCNVLLQGEVAKMAWPVWPPRGFVRVSFKEPCVSILRFQAVQYPRGVRNWELHIVKPDDEEVTKQLVFFDPQGIIFRDFDPPFHAKAVLLQMTAEPGFEVIKEKFDPKYFGLILQVTVT
eukprot:CAMPEP_0117463304 /NCGR_PEP_ID=MMETSP0784-20121206/3507_1 /TAXON_ID=39447 /ORGANISM="" /LENGTH=433 /DNA_ID=CAMNT_0005257109 /DNA_START=144 /DNA_END=1441 /DNA_ORIENTATION=+